MYFYFKTMGSHKKTSKIFEFALTSIMIFINFMDIGGVFINLIQLPSLSSARSTYSDLTKETSSGSPCS